MEQKDNSGALFKNDRKESDNHPDYKGSIMVGGVEHWISAWNNTSKAGKKYMGLAVSIKEDKPTTKAVEDNTPVMADDDIPF